MKEKHQQRNKIHFFGIPLLLCVFLSSSILCSGLTDCRYVNIHTTGSELPLSLQYVDDEAFAGTSLSTISFRDNLIVIGYRAFENNDRLTDVFIPSSVQSIGFDAFPANTLIHGADNTYVESWAEEYGYKYVVDEFKRIRSVPESFHFEWVLFLLCFLLPANDEKLILICRRIKLFVKSMRPQDRIELYPINYKFP